MQSDFYDSKKTLLKLQQMYYNFFRFFVIQHKKICSQKLLLAGKVKIL